MSSVLLGLFVVVALVIGDWGNWVARSWGGLDLVHIAVVVFLVVSGWRLAARPNQRGNGWLLIAAGVSVSMSWITWQNGPFLLIAWVGPVWTGLLLAWLLLRVPGNRLTDRYDRLFLAISFPLTLALRLFETLTWDMGYIGYVGPGWWPTLIHSEHLHTIVFSVMWGASIPQGVVFLVLLFRKHKRTSWLSRRQAMPLLVAGVIGALVFGLFEPALQLVVLAHPQWLDKQYFLQGIAESAAILVVLGAFVMAAFLKALQRSRIHQLLVDREVERNPEALQRALRTVLVDPELQLLFRAAADDDWVDVTGEHVEVADAGPEVLIPVDDSRGTPLAAILTDKDVAGQGDLLDAAVAASRMALDNARLQALAQARLEEVTRSRQRLAQVGLAERRRLERDLHDGAQQRLLSVAAGLASARAATDDPMMKRRLDDVRDGIRLALQELRDLANGIHPAVLTQSGLGPAIESAAERLALPARIEVESRRWPQEVESATYFVTSEALANAVKHADAGLLSVSAVTDGTDLLLTIVDDGSGGATARPRQGGLTGMSDRVAALGGTLRIDSPLGGGTKIVARFPCG